MLGTNRSATRRSEDPGRRRAASHSVVEFCPRPAYLALPFPRSLTDCGLFSALSIIIKVAFDDPPAVGANTTAMLQFPPGGSGALQPLVTVNGLPAPLTPSISTVIPGFFWLPLGLLTVTFRGPL